MKKNYKQHLKNVHPNADPKDLRGQGQTKLTDMFKPKSSVREGSVPALLVSGDEPGEEEDAETVDKVDDYIFTPPDDEVSNRKRRHESGESVDSGIGETTSEWSKQPKTESITLNVLNEKIDMVLEGVRDLKRDKVVMVEKEVTQVKMKGVDEDCDEIGLKFCRSMGEILKAGFMFDEENSSVFCSVCVGEAADAKFSYDSIHGLEFPSDEYIPRDFSNLKKNVLRHIFNSKTHTNAVKDIEKREKAANDLKSKNTIAGLNLGRACMKNYSLGRPYTDFESDVLLLKQAGAEVGELNHSRKFPAALRPYVSKAVHRRVKEYMSTPMEQTGHLPVVGLAADKGTYKHRGRQFLSFVTMIAGGNNLLEICTAGQPVVTQGSTGIELAKNMKAGFDEFGIIAEQIESGVFDGVYFHCSIEEHLGTLYKFKPDQVAYTWDPLHKTGLVDKDMTKQDSFKWLQDIIACCQQIFSTFNWGANYEKFREATAVWRLSLSNLVNFSETRFANSKRKVFKNIHHQFAPIITCLEDQVRERERNINELEAANSKVREKGLKAKELLGRILNADFLFILSGLTDIYENFGAIVQVTQMVHLLPHERLDLYNKSVQRLIDMGHCQNHQDCARYAGDDDKIKCLWPLSHEDKKTFKEDSKIRKLPIQKEVPVRAAGLQVVTRNQAAERSISAEDNSEERTDKKLLSVVKNLSIGLKQRVYSPDGIATIEQTRVILDLPALASKIKTPGGSATKVAATEFQNFKKAVTKIPIISLKEVPEEELKAQFKIFINRLGAMTAKLTPEELLTTDAKELIKTFMEPAEKLYKDIEMIMQVCYEFDFQIFTL